MLELLKQQHESSANGSTSAAKVPAENADTAADDIPLNTEVAIAVDESFTDKHGSTLSGTSQIAHSPFCSSLPSFLHTAFHSAQSMLHTLYIAIHTRLQSHSPRLAQLFEKLCERLYSAAPYVIQAALLYLAVKLLWLAVNRVRNLSEDSALYAIPGVKWIVQELQAAIQLGKHNYCCYSCLPPIRLLVVSACAMVSLFPAMLTRRWLFLLLLHHMRLFAAVSAGFGSRR